MSAEHDAGGWCCWPSLRSERPPSCRPLRSRARSSRGTPSTSRSRSATAARQSCSYKLNGKWQHPLVWGAINARPPSRTVKQVELQDRLLRRLGHVPQADLEDDEEPLPAVRRPEAPVAGEGVQGAGRLLLGASELAADAPEPRHDAVEARARRSGSSTSPTGAASCPSSTCTLDWIYSQKFHHLFGKFTYKGVPVHGFKATTQREPARHTTGATSTSTRTTRRTARAGSVRTRSSCTTRAGTSVTASTCTTGTPGTRAARSGRRVTGRSTAGRSWAPA